MPTTPIMQIPRTKDAEEFENMCCDVLTKKYDTFVDLYGRLGQNQNGIDSVSQSDIVVQCKNYYKCSYEKLQDQIERDIVSAKNLPFPFKTFIIMTSLDRDKNIQDFILNIDADFEIQIFFWDNIQTELCNDITLLKKYYPSFFLESSESIITNQDKKDLIFNAIGLKSQVENISNYSNYIVGCECDSDDQVYNICACIFHAVSELCRLRNKWCLKLNKNNIIKLINNLEKNIPDFYDGRYDECSKVFTITEFIRYFSDAKNKNKFIEYCDKIIEELDS